MRVRKSDKINSVLSTKISPKNNVDASKFTELFDQKNEDKKREELNQMIEKIKQRGAELVESKNVELLVNYKKMVKEFISNAVDFAFEIHEKKGFSRLGRNKILKIVSMVDSSLVEITQNFLSDERSRINMLAKIGELNGLLMNIFV